MNEIIDFLNKNSGALNVIFTAVVTVATAVYAVLTWKLVTETRLMREVQTEPKLSVTLRSIDEAIHIVRLHFQNIGQGPALSVKFTPRVESGNESSAALLENFTKPNYFNTGLSYFGPGQERVSMYTQLTENHEAKLSTVLAFDVEYKSVTGKTYKDTLIVDMSEYKGTHQLGKPHLYAIAQSLERLQKDVDRLVGGSKRLQADVFSREDRVWERKERDEWIAEQRRNASA
ncbi:hypothetical protein [Polaromonas sp.]|uniref:hypothetical protein n=1 Tax=Polaromonas sp. TaxID=1869339 RepID=UPI0013BE2D4D|nr:hypothetical protein [Polaromonas sp.]NDP62966.1 hypothetical protein [Polaromonas sp.]